MRHWSFVSGLTLLLLLMLALSGYCIWATRGLTSELDRLITLNYDKIRAMRELRTSMIRINARYLGNPAIGREPIGFGMFENESEAMRKQLEIVRAGGSDPREIEQLERMDLLVKEYLANFRLLFTLAPDDFGRRDQIWEALSRGTVDIADHTEVITNMNERSLLAQRDAAVERGRFFGWAALGIAGISLGIYVFTSVRLTQGVFRPLRQLRDAIQQVGRREFEVVKPLAGGEELTQIAATFNQMASELRAYIAETDQRSVEASRISRAILEALPYPIYIVDEAYKVRLKNPRAQALSAALKISGHLPGVVKKCVDDAAATGSELIGDDLHRAVEVPLPDGEPGPTPTFLPQVFRMADVPGSTSGWAVLLVDVTQLCQFDQAKNKAIATLGHEVKTPVTSIRMALHLLLEEKVGPLTADQRDLVTAGRDDCERLLKVLEALMELARFEGGRVQMNLTPTAPADLMAQAEEMHLSYLRGNGAALVVEPTPDALAMVQADTTHAARILGNFLSNAAKYRTPGTPVTMRAEARADGFVRISVRNYTKEPLSESEQARVFDPFYRRAGEGAEGSGLGLTICREIAALHQGRVGVWAGENEVEFYLDLRAVSANGAPAQTAGPAALVART